MNMDTVLAMLFGMLMYVCYMFYEVKRIQQTATIFLWLACISTAVASVIELNHAVPYK